MIDPKRIRENPDILKESQKRRGEDPAHVDAWLIADQKWRQANIAFDEARAEQKNLSKKIGYLQGRKKKYGLIDTEEKELRQLLQKTEALSDKIAQLEDKKTFNQKKSQDLLRTFANIVADDSPVGSEEMFVTLRKVGTIRNFANEGFEPKDHVEIGKHLHAIDIERGAKVSGSRFYYLTGPGALLEFALIHLAIDTARKNGYTPVIPPSLVKPAAMEGTGFLDQAAENVYYLPEDDMYLIGTSEVSLAAYHMDEILNADDLPIKYVGYSPCFRREAGSHGKDTRGIFRVHWFDKVEMFIFCDPEHAEKEHLGILEIEEKILQQLELPYRVIDVATGDLGSSAAKKFDCEAWIPTMNTYRELTSTSNCTEFQSRRLKIRQRNDETIKPIATLNGTLIALTRTIIAILENHQQKNGTVKIPQALRPYLNNKEYLEPLP